MDGTHENTEDSGISLADYGSKGVRNVALKNSGKSVSDLTIFKYCLGGLADRSHLLKEIVTSFSDEEILEFAHQVSIYTGCSHHR